MIESERRTGGDRRKFTGAQKAAALLIVLGKDAAPNVLRHLTKDEVLDIAKAASTLGIVDRQTLERMIDEFSLDFVDGPELIGGSSVAHELVASRLEPQDIAKLADGTEPEQAVDVWRELSQLSEDRIAELLSGEPAWIAAAVLRRMEAGRVSEILAVMADEQRLNALGVMLSAAPAAPAALGMLEAALWSALSRGDEAGRSEDTQNQVADIVNRLNGDVVEDVLTYLTAIAPDQATAIRAKVFRFEQLPALSAPDRAKLFDGVPTERVVLALKGASAEVVEAALGSLGARARRMVESELASDGLAPAREIGTARRMIVDAVLRLSAEGTIAIPSNS